MDMEALKKEYEFFQNLCNEFANINIWVLPDYLFKEYVTAGTSTNSFDCVVTVSEGRLIACLNNSGELQIEEFHIEDYRYAADWCLGKIKYQDYLDLPYSGLRKMDKEDIEETDIEEIISLGKTQE